MVDPFNPRLKIRSDYLAAIIVTLAPLVYFLPALLQGLVLSPDDGILQNVPLRIVAAQLVRSGSFPLWNPYIFGGMPLLGAAQGGLLFPLNWFYLLYSPATATNLMVLSTFMAAALGAFLFARRTGSSVTGAALTSLTWQAGGFLVNQISHINIVQTAALLPWVLWAIERYVVSGSRTFAGVIALLIALQIFAGHQQVFAYAALLISAYAIVMAPGDRERRRRYLVSLGFGGVGVLLGAVQILPTWELLRNSVRATASYDFFASFSMPKAYVMTFLAPFLMGGGDGRLFRAPYIGQSFYTEYVPYAGVLAIMLALVALVVRPDRRTKFWAGVVIVGLLLAFGGNAPLSFNRLVYFVPVLNLFRVPARHLMEVYFAVAMLAGRGLTVLSNIEKNQRKRYIWLIAIGVFVLTCLIVTVGRPAEFQLSRKAPVSLIRAPELFMPILIAAASAVALCFFAHKRRGSTLLLFTVIAADLMLWGQFSAWYISCRRIPEEYWSVPESVQLLRDKVQLDPDKYRILTTHLPFDPKVSVPYNDHGWVLWTEPDIYMIHGIRNAAGYDGFGLQRYSELAGQMKLWGELTDANATLRSNSREIDILNTRYVVARHERPIIKKDNETSAAAVVSPSNFPVATEQYGEFMFGKTDLSLPNIGATKRLRFKVPAVESDHVALLTNLSFAEEVPDNAVVATLHLRASDGRTFEFPLRAGIDTADWAYDRADLRKRIRHKKPGVATSYDVTDAQYKYQGHTYVTSFALPEKATIEGGEIELESPTQWPGLLLTLFRLSLVDASAGKSYPLTREMISVESVSTSEGSSQTQGGSADRWQLVGHGLDENIYENTRALPRAWLISEVRALDEQAVLQVIRTGFLPDSSAWDPSKTVLVDNQVTSLPPIHDGGQVDAESYEANRIKLRTHATGQSLLVLSENDYPGWRAYVDGQMAPILRVNYYLRGVVVPQGEHEITFLYRPLSVMIGGLVSVLGAICFSLSLMYVGRTK
jgi:Bacterial membrane protein YfhO